MTYLSQHILFQQFALLFKSFSSQIIFVITQKKQTERDWGKQGEGDNT